ncbi:MAG: NAD(P)H-dependent oxidoreductase subunit E, partial [Clostridia bacterium]|nr:NAD(P)H-dependent oxidoreductase subunit E [Clostridia bacterium]
MIKNFEELEKVSCECSKCLAAKFSGEDKKRHIVLCGGTGCLSSNSAEILAEFQKQIKEKHLEDKVSVNQVGCFGFCSQGPFVKIYPEDTLYRMVKIEDVAEIMERDIIGGEIVDRLLYIDPKNGEKVVKQDEINFYKKQRRIALNGCGSINPEDIKEGFGAGAFKGLARALKMDRQAVIDEVLASGIRGRGGAGFPTGRKWQFAYAQPDGEKYVICNGDEGDPGAFMDEAILEGNPLAVIEGMMIA